jgi:hypothetical protein
MRLGLLIAGVVATGCAARKPTPLALHAEITSPSPARETCKAGDTTQPALAVTVHDEAAAALPGVLLYLGATSGRPESLTAQTDDLGTATMHAPTSGVYVLTVALVGFTPEVRQLALKSGCSGQVDVALKLGPAVIER